MINPPLPLRLPGFLGVISDGSNGANGQYEADAYLAFCQQAKKNFPLLKWNPSIANTNLAYVEGWLISRDILLSIGLQEKWYWQFGPKISAVFPLNFRSCGIEVYDSFRCFNVRSIPLQICHVENTLGASVPSKICTHIPQPEALQPNGCVIEPLQATLSLYCEYLSIQQHEKKKFSLECYSHGKAGLMEFFKENHYGKRREIGLFTLYERANLSTVEFQRSQTWVHYCRRHSSYWRSGWGGFDGKCIR